MVTLNKRKNSTSLDELALKYGMVRDKKESLSSFRDRIDKYISNIGNTYKNFERSLGYITRLQDFDVFLIEKNTSEIVDIEISDTRIKIFFAGNLYYMEKLENLKFLKDLHAVLTSIDFITCEVVTNEDWMYLKTKNLIQCNTERCRYNYLSDTQVNVLPDDNVGFAQDRLGVFNTQVFDENDVSNEKYYAIENEKVLTKYNDREEYIEYIYSDFPFVIRWSPIRSYSLNNFDIDDLLKDTVSTTETFGFLSDATVEVTSDFKLLSQKGAKIINRVLEQQNTYWGE